MIYFLRKSCRFASSIFFLNSFMHGVVTPSQLCSVNLDAVSVIRAYKEIIKTLIVLLIGRS